MKTAKANSGAYCSMAAIRYAKVLYDMELPEEVKKSLQISFMKTVDDALAFALVGKKA